MSLNTQSSHKRINKVLVYVGLIVASLLVVFPFAIILITSFKTQTDALSWDFSIIGEKDGFSLQGYKAFFNYQNYETEIPWIWSGLLSTMITSVIPTVGSLFFGSLRLLLLQKYVLR